MAFNSNQLHVPSIYQCYLIGLIETKDVTGSIALKEEVKQKSDVDLESWLTNGQNEN